MDWKLLLGGSVLTLLGGFILIRFRKTNYNKDLDAGCLMSSGAIMLLTGVLAAGLSFMMPG
ncbi:MAG: hypothetical protein EON61_22815 [Alphaproteobacteria bacterium]|jgi:hypothetical protein|nr:MAG: hypothetical protein EON61_22815 [Alphaproteobacteria bacterium]